MSQDRGSPESGKGHPEVSKADVMAAMRMKMIRYKQRESGEWIAVGPTPAAGWSSSSTSTMPTMTTSSSTTG